MNRKILGLLIAVVAVGLLAVGPVAADGPESSTQPVTSISEQPLEDCEPLGCLETDLSVGLFGYECGGEACPYNGG